MRGNGVTRLRDGWRGRRQCGRKRGLAPADGKVICLRHRCGRCDSGSGRQYYEYLHNETSSPVPAAELLR